MADHGMTAQLGVASGEESPTAVPAGALARTAPSASMPSSKPPPMTATSVQSPSSPGRTPPAPSALMTTAVTDNPGWKPRRSGRGGMPGPPDCRTRPRDWAGVRFRLSPTPAQETALLGHCAQARFGWNLALEQANSYGTAGRKASPNFAAQCRQLTEARAEHAWLAAGSQTVQQQARHEGFRIVGGPAGRVRRLNRKWAEALVPKVGWVRFRLSRAIPDAKSYRVTRDSAGRWHIAFAAIPAAIPAPGTGEVVGVDRGVAVAAALSTGELRRFDTDSLDAQVRRTQRRLGRAQRGSHRRRRVKARLARRHARRADARKDWVGKLSTDLARRFDLIRVEDLRVRNMTRSAKGTVDAPGTNVRQKAGLNRAILD